MFFEHRLFGKNFPPLSTPPCSHAVLPTLNVAGSRTACHPPRYCREVGRSSVRQSLGSARSFPLDVELEEGQMADQCEPFSPTRMIHHSIRATQRLATETRTYLLPTHPCPVLRATLSFHNSAWQGGANDVTATSLFVSLPSDNGCPSRLRVKCTERAPTCVILTADRWMEAGLDSNVRALF